MTGFVREELEAILALMNATDAASSVGALTAGTVEVRNEDAVTVGYIERAAEGYLEFKPLSRPIKKDDK